MVKKQDYWFGAKRYGYGWGLPTRMEGWVVMGSYLLFVLVSTLIFTSRPDNKIESDIWLYLSAVFISTLALLIVVIAHGPKPEWHWGDSSSKKKK